jgi:hypothetical protein
MLIYIFQKFEIILSFKKFIISIQKHSNIYNNDNNNIRLYI